MLESQSIGHLNFGADLNAPAASDALVRIVLQGDVFSCIVTGWFNVRNFSEGVVAELIFVGITLEVALAVFVASGTPAPVFAEKQFENGLSDLPNFFSIGSYDEAVPGYCRAGGGQTSLALDLDEAQSAGTGGCQSGVVAEIRNLYTVGKSDLQNCLSRRRSDLPAVYCQFQLFHAQNLVLMFEIAPQAPVRLADSGFGFESNDHFMEIQFSLSDRDILLLLSCGCRGQFFLRGLCK